MSSKIAICNTALGMLGASPIRAFDEDSKRARACDVMYETVRKYLLAKFDWPFARTYAKLQAVDVEGPPEIIVPSGYVMYQLPADCITPRDIAPLGSKDVWQVLGNTILVKSTTTDVTYYLYYTKDESKATFFSSTFESLLATALAVKLGPAITQDKALVRELKDQYRLETIEAWESDANIGTKTHMYDNDPDNSTFVYPGGVVEDTDGRL